MNTFRYSHVILQIHISQYKRDVFVHTWKFDEKENISKSLIGQPFKHLESSIFLDLSIRNGFSFQSRYRALFKLNIIAFIYSNATILLLYSSCTLYTIKTGKNCSNVFYLFYKIIPEQFNIGWNGCNPSHKKRIKNHMTPVNNVTWKWFIK